jgi:hypothetical protein
MRLKKRSIWFLWRYSHGLKAKFRLRMTRGGTLAKAPRSTASARMASVS